MRVASLTRISAGLFNAFVLGAVPVAAWLAIGPVLVSDTHAALLVPEAGVAAADQELPIASDAGRATEHDATGPVALLDAWYYTDHDCASPRGRERGRGHEQGRGHERERSPKGCPTQQRGHGR